MAANFGMQTGPSQRVVGTYDNATGQQIGGGWQGQYGGSMGYRPVGATNPLAGFGTASSVNVLGGYNQSGAYNPQGVTNTNTTIRTPYAAPNPFAQAPAWALQGTTQGSFGGAPGGGYPNSFTGVGAVGLPTNMGGLLGLQMQQNADARAKNEAIYNEAKGNLLGVMGRYGSDPVAQQARTNALNMAQNYQLNPQDAINRASNLVNAGANARAMALQGQLAASGQLGGSGQFAAQDALERQRMAQLADTGANIQTEYGQLNFQRGLQATGQAANVAGQRSGLDMGVANSFIGNLPQYLPDDYSAYARLLALQGGGPGGSASMFNGSGGGVNQLGPILQQISGNQSGRVAGGNAPFGFQPAPQGGGFMGPPTPGGFNQNFNPNAGPFPNMGGGAAGGQVPGGGQAVPGQQPGGDGYIYDPVGMPSMGGYPQGVPSTNANPAAGASGSSMAGAMFGSPSQPSMGPTSYNANLESSLGAPRPAGIYQGSNYYQPGTFSQQRAPGIYAPDGSHMSSDWYIEE